MASLSSSILAPSKPHAQTHSMIRSRAFSGLRPMKGNQLSMIPKSRTAVSGRSMTCRAEMNPQLVISLSTGLSLFLGRFVFFNFQRENVAKQVPEQNGQTHFEAGDVRAKEYVSLLKSNDPVGFNIVDVLAWGSIGHIVAYYILATSSNGYDPSFF
ncbi:unnamed protein product [Amaranthus hypochondriacus]